MNHARSPIFRIACPCSSVVAAVSNPVIGQCLSVVHVFKDTDTATGEGGGGRQTRATRLLQPSVG